MLDPAYVKLANHLASARSTISAQWLNANILLSAGDVEDIKPKLSADRLGAMLGDNLTPSSNNAAMNDITREEFNAKLETIEVKMDARVESISSKIEGFLAAQAERDRRLDESIAGVRRDIDKLGSLKLNIWGAMLTAIGVGVAITALSVSFYQTGKVDTPRVIQPSPTINAPATPVLPKN